MARVATGALVHTDEYDIYARLPDWAHGRKTVCHGRGEYARDEDGDGFHEVDVDTIEGFQSPPRSRPRPHRGISQEKPPLYLAFFPFAHNVRKRGKAPLCALLEAIVAPSPRNTLRANRKHGHFGAGRMLVKTASLFSSDIGYHLYVYSSSDFAVAAEVVVLANTHVAPLQRLRRIGPLGATFSTPAMISQHTGLEDTSGAFCNESWASAGDGKNADTANPTPAFPARTHVANHPRIRQPPLRMGPKLTRRPLVSNSRRHADPFRGEVFRLRWRNSCRDRLCLPL